MTKEENMTPTPEEYLKELRISENLIDSNLHTIVCQALKEYALAYHKEMVENVSSGLPSHKEVFSSLSCESLATDLEKDIFFHGSDWMKEAASIVIAKLKSIIDHHTQQNLFLQQQLEQKDKEIEDLNKTIDIMEAIIKSINTNKT